MTGALADPAGAADTPVTRAPAAGALTFAVVYHSARMMRSTEKPDESICLRFRLTRLRGAYTIPTRNKIAARRQSGRVSPNE